MERFAAILFITLLGVPGVVLGDQLPPPPGQRSHQHRDSRSPQTSTDSARIAQWAERLVDELEHLQEDLVLEHQQHTSRLIDRAERALQAAIHFERVAKRNVNRQHLIGDFREMDQSVHDLLQLVETSQDRFLRRAGARVRYADEQLHYLLVARDTGGNDAFRELVARHAHVLENETKQLERAARYFRDHYRYQNDRTYDAVRDLAEQAQHFHRTVEQFVDREHVRRDFRELDRSWHQAAQAINNSPYDAYLRRSAQRVGRVHDQLHQLLDPQSRSARVEIEIPGIGRFRF